MNNTDIKILKFVRLQELRRDTCEMNKTTSKLNVTRSDVLKLDKEGYISSEVDSDVFTGYYLTKKSTSVIRY